MTETMYVSAVSTTVDGLVSLIEISPFAVPTYVLDADVTTADARGLSQGYLGYSIPEEVDVRGWLELTEHTLDFWDNDEDAIYDDY